MAARLRIAARACSHPLRHEQNPKNCTTYVADCTIFVAILGGFWRLFLACSQTLLATSLERWAENMKGVK